jgi:hypothetical protein
MLRALPEVSPDEEEVSPDEEGDSSLTLSMTYT